ncbi:MAG: hypothetical protein HQM08_24475 [Candidatus Riflebacteria bacterium]|nr:hypothetical protein [Candidatus Riflebacteria bacterium]
MGRIFGMVDFSGKPFSQEKLSKIRKKAALYRPDYLNIFVKDAYMLGYSHFISTPESEFEKMPSWDEQLQFALVANARLDNRETLLNVFDVPQHLRSCIPDGKLIYWGFQRWGADCPKYFRGDWSFAVWDENRKRIFVARDQCGNTGLFYYFKKGIFVFSSDISGVFDLSDASRSLNEKALAQFLNFIPGFESQTTIWKDVFLLPSAYLLSVDSQDLKVFQYWNLNDAKPLRLSADSDYTERFIGLIEKAVQTRVRSKGAVGTHLSGGLDSSTVTAFVARQIIKSSEKVYSFTYVPLYSAEHLFPNAICNEWQLADKLSEKYKNIVHIPVDAKNFSPVKIIHESLNLLETPVHSVSNLFWAAAIREEAHKLGIKTMLTGQLGNGGISWDGGKNRIYSLFREGNFSTGLKELRAAGKYRKNMSRAIKNFVLKPLLMPWINYAKGLFSVRQSPWLDFSAINMEFANKSIQTCNINQSFRNVLSSPPITPLKERETYLMINATIAGSIFHQENNWSSLQTLDLTADLDLLEFCLSVPLRLFTLKGGSRMLLRKSMEGILPPEIQWNPRRGKQASDIVFRLIGHKDDVEDELNEMEKSAVLKEYLNMKGMRAVWNHICKHGEKLPDNGAISILMRGIQVGIFLKKFFG